MTHCRVWLSVDKSHRLLLPVEDFQVPYVFHAFQGIRRGKEKVGDDLTGIGTQGHQFVVDVE